MLVGSSLFDALASHVRVQPDRQGEVWIACPSCGAKQKHFSFSARGAHCHKCGYSPALKALAEQLGLRDQRPYAAPREVERPRPAPKPWQAQADLLARNYAQTPGAAQAWAAYKPISPETRLAHLLGLGVVPSCKCRHPRLIVPLFKAGQVVGFRGRLIACDCPQKWISPAGSEMVLYNAEAIVTGKPVTIVENPIDALMLGEQWGEIAVATLGVSIWKDGYTDLVRRASEVTVAFDNDVAGNLHTPEAIADWKKTHPNGNPALGGLVTYNKLVAAGVDASLYDWGGADAGTDWGDILCAMQPK
jgi:hypothetical protein